MYITHDVTFFSIFVVKAFDIVNLWS